ncbi:MAG: 4-alpha-glucanotransferase [Alphaproteobacteria bacterium]|nr:4-alpha-glucanotransferase [Alphaproteobacteria bacterium]
MGKENINLERLNLLAEKAGIWLEFLDRGTNTRYEADLLSKQTILKSLGYKSDTNQEIEASINKMKADEYSFLISKTHVVRLSESEDTIIKVYLQKEFENENLIWKIKTDQGEEFYDEVPLSLLQTIQEDELNGKLYIQKELSLMLDLEMGYYELTVSVGKQKETSSLIIVPDTCYMNEALADDKKVFGYPVQLYAIRSKRNWGIGDFKDLEGLIDVAKKTGASFIGVNPLSALFQDNPNDASPYFPSSRLFLNPIYVDIEGIAERENYVQFQRWFSYPSIQRLLKMARRSKTVDYSAVMGLKKSALKILFKRFKELHFDINGKPKTKRGEDFNAFLKEKGVALQNFAVFQVLRDKSSLSKTSMMWREWDKALQNPNSKKVKEFIKENEIDIFNIYYQQFIAFEQLNAVIEKAKSLSLGLYTDMPVGVSDNSAEVWSDQTSFMQGVTTGAPPDAFNQKGQDWSLAPFNPLKLHQTGYKSFINVIKSVMKGAGAVRIDHAFGLMRLYLRVQGGTGAYLTFPFKELTGIIALESHLNKCVVIAEDLGTAPDGFSNEMIKLNAFSFKIMHFERDWNGFIEPHCYPANSLISTGTHDLPSYTSFYKELDLELAKKMKTISLEQYTHHKENRKVEKDLFKKAFEKQGFEIKQSKKEDLKTVPNWFIPSVYKYLSLTNSKILLIRPEDVFEMEEQFNLPGTYMEYPNWRYKLPIPLEEMLQDKRLKDIVRIIKKQRD